MRTQDILMLSLFPAMLLAARPLGEVLTLQPDSKVWVAGTSSVRDYRCTTTALQTKIQAPSAAAALSLGALVSNAEIEVPVAKLECGNGTMNGHMRKALKGEEFPNVKYDLKSYTIAGGDITLQGTLTIAGKSLPVEMTGTVTEENGLVRASATQQIKMSEWGVKPPSLMFGTMKVHDPVTIGFDIALQR